MRDNRGKKRAEAEAEAEAVAIRRDKGSLFFRAIQIFFDLRRIFPKKRFVILKFSESNSDVFSEIRIYRCAENSFNMTVYAKTTIATALLG